MEHDFSCLQFSIIEQGSAVHFNAFHCSCDTVASNNLQLFSLTHQYSQTVLRDNETMTLLRIHIKTSVTWCLHKRSRMNLLCNLTEYQSSIHIKHLSFYSVFEKCSSTYRKKHNKQLPSRFLKNTFKHIPLFHISYYTYISNL